MPKPRKITVRLLNRLLKENAADRGMCLEEQKIILEFAKTMAQSSGGKKVRP